MDCYDLDYFGKTTCSLNNPFKKIMASNYIRSHSVKGCHSDNL